MRIADCIDYVNKVILPYVNKSFKIVKYRLLLAIIKFYLYFGT